MLSQLHLWNFPDSCDQQRHCDSNRHFDEAVQRYHPRRAAMGDQQDYAQGDGGDAIGLFDSQDCAENSAEENSYEVDDPVHPKECRGECTQDGSYSCAYEALPGPV